MWPTKWSLLLSFVFYAATALAQPTELFISEYIEGSSNNKAIEIFNGTGSSIDLAAGNYELLFFFNGNTTATTTISLSGTVADGDVFVVADNNSVQAILDEADQTSTSNFFNGNDAVALVKNGVNIDVFGQIGTDPGTSWPGGGANVTLLRNANIISGDTDGSDAFDASVEWSSFSEDNFDDLGQHSIGCIGPSITQQPQSISVTEGSPASFIAEANGVGTLSYQWQLRANGAGSFFDISITSETLTFPSPGLPSDGNQYRVIITDDNGTPSDPSDDCEVTSDAATLSVRLPVAITEFMNNSIGADREFLELRNFGSTSVELVGWTLSDEDGDDVTFPPYTLAADGYLLVVLSRFGESVADAKADFEREWFGGAPQDNILVVANTAF
ncbi:MAG: lamin tail domain-containing protein, partial [Bacteroidota bacterium]